MKTNLAVIITGWIAMLLSLNPAYAQAPNSIAGDGFLIGITSGTYPFGSFGYYLFIPANSGNTYQTIGIYDILNSSGTYSYSATSPSAATVSINDSQAGLGNTYVSFSTLNSGSFTTTANSYPGAYQTGTFNYASVSAPSSIVGKTFVCTVADGLSPFLSSGSYTLYIATSGNTFTDSLGESGTYSYSLVNRSTGKLQINDSDTGTSTVYFGFTDASDGGFAVAQPSSGGFQIGSFVVIDTPWPDATSLDGGWMSSSWFGEFNVNNYPWIYHQQHGWMYVFGTDPTSIWLWTSDLGFLWTGSTVYPWIWSDSQQTWLYYSIGTSNPRWFFNWNAQKWVTVNP